MRFYLNKQDPDFVESLFYRLKINSVEDIYNGVGKILKSSQEWEQKYKEFCILFDLEIKDYSHITLNAMTKELFDKKIISDIENKKLTEIIKIRNEFYHQYFLDQYWSYPYEEVEETLNSIWYLIDDSIDFVENKINETKGKGITHIKTILDNQNLKLSNNGDKE